MKKLLNTIFTIMICAVCAFVFAACAPETSSGNNGGGVSVTKAEMNENGELIITLSDGNSFNVGKITAENGRSAYEIYKTYHPDYQGTEQEWIEAVSDKSLTPDEEGTEGLAYYPLPDGTYAVAMGTTKYLENIVIPGSHNGKPVSAIAEEAFYDHDSGNTNNAIKSVTIGSNVTSIGNGAFYCCSNLTSITIPDSVTNIGEWAFMDCGSLTSAVFGNGLTSIGEDAFRNCDNLTSVTLPDGVTNIGVSAFHGCDNLTTAIIGDGVATVDNCAFFKCVALKSVVMGAEVANIGNGAFFGCAELETVYYKGTAETWKNISIDENNNYLTDANIYYYSETEPVGNGDHWHYVDGAPTVYPLTLTQGLGYALNDDGVSYSVTGIGAATDTYVVIPSTYDGKPVTSIGAEAFRNCDDLTCVIIPDSITNIGNSAFFGCDNLASIKIGNGVTTINSGAFFNCKALKSVVVGKSVTTIGNSAFFGCADLKIVYYEGNAEAWSAITIDDNNNYLTDAKVCYYSETTPANSGNYWHYNDDDKPIAR